MRRVTGSERDRHGDHGEEQRDRREPDGEARPRQGCPTASAARPGCAEPTVHANARGPRAGTAAAMSAGRAMVGPLAEPPRNCAGAFCSPARGRGPRWPRRSPRRWRRGRGCRDRRGSGRRTPGRPALRPRRPRRRRRVPRAARRATPPWRRPRGRARDGAARGARRSSTTGQRLWPRLRKRVR